MTTTGAVLGSTLYRLSDGGPCVKLSSSAPQGHPEPRPSPARTDGPGPGPEPPQDGDGGPTRRTTRRARAPQQPPAQPAGATSASQTRHARPRATESSAITDVKAPGPAKRDMFLATDAAATGSVPKRHAENRLSARVGANAPPQSPHSRQQCRRHDGSHDRARETRRRARSCRGDPTRAVCRPPSMRTCRASFR